MAGRLSHVPATVLAQWIEDSEQPAVIRGWNMVIMCSILGAASVAVVGARLWLRVVQQKIADLSDLFTFIALILTLGLLIISSLACKVYGFDHHIWNIQFDQLTPLIEVLFAVVFLTIFAEGFIRLSILLFYRNIVHNHPRKAFRIAIWIVFALCCATIVSFVIALCFVCTPLDALWNYLNPAWQHPYKCYDLGVYIIVFTAENAVLDFVLSLMPIPVLWNLQIPTRQKVALWGLFSMGVFAAVAGLLRMYWAYYAFYQTYDFTWNAYGMLFWTCIECPMALIGSSLPALKALFSRFLEHRRQTRGSTAATKQNSGSGSSKEPFRIRTSNAQSPTMISGGEGSARPSKQLSWLRGAMGGLELKSQDFSMSRSQGQSTLRDEEWDGSQEKISVNEVHTVPEMDEESPDADPRPPKLELRIPTSESTFHVSPVGETDTLGGLDGTSEGNNHHRGWVISKSVTISTEIEERDGESMDDWIGNLKGNTTHRLGT